MNQLKKKKKKTNKEKTGTTYHYVRISSKYE